MPEIYQRRVKTESVRDALSEMRRGLLPEEIRNDAIARWILTFDGLRPVRAPEFPDQRRNRENEFTIWIVEAMLSTALQRQVPFYFSALFHIGRQWSVSEKSLVALGKATTSENLAASALQTTKSLSERTSLSRGLRQIADYPPELLARELSPLLEAAREQHNARMREARRWWKAWREEAENLRNQVTGIQERGREILDERLWPQVAMMTFQGQRPSPLRLSMQASGLQFKGEAVSSEGSLLGFNDAALPMMLAALASSGGKYGPPLRYFDEYVRHYFYDAMKEAHYRPLREVALRRLDEKYRDSDPFDLYRPLKKPASEDLRNLIVEHTLPGHEKSPWLTVWEGCLAPEPSSGLSEGDVTDFDTIRAFAASADSTIKTDLHEEDIELGEPWARFMQRLFESWLHDIAEEVANRHKAGKGSKKVLPWDFKHFTILVEGVVGFLAKMGYQLKLPSSDRLKKLWEALHSKEPGDTSDW